jgi:glyoxalase family protein
MNLNLNKIMNKLLGLHHITAIAGDAQRNYDFYTKALGFRLVKKTVNFDDPQTYHFYFGDEKGNPGTILTFFPWANVRQGKNGAGMATEIGYSVSTGSLDFWKARFEKLSIRYENRERFNEKQIAFQDPDGLWLTLIEAKQNDERKGFETAEIKADVAIKGFHTVTLTQNNIKATALILTEVFGYRQVEQEGNLYRYQTDAVKNAAIVDLLEMPQAQRGINAAGTNHHVAFRVKDEETLMAFREKIVARGLHITEKINRDYFFSLYFREPGGVLFEIATDNPGFATDETVENLGSSLQLPDQYKVMREQIERGLPKIQM